VQSSQNSTLPHMQLQDYTWRQHSANYRMPPWWKRTAGDLNGHKLLQAGRNQLRRDGELLSLTVMSESGVTSVRLLGGLQ